MFMLNNYNCQVRKNMKSIREEWRDIIGFENTYRVSSIGRVLSVNYNKTGSSKVLTPFKVKGRYLQVTLKGKRYSVHRLVAKAFIPNPNNLPYINHKDENGLNNSVDNLEWCTAKYNSNYGTCPRRIGASNQNSNTKKVYQYDLKGNLIREFKSRSEASRATGVGLMGISMCCQGGHYQNGKWIKINQSGGFIWKNQ